MKPFMENICGHPHCMGPECKKCGFFTPKAFGSRVPKRLGLVLFKLVEWRDYRRTKKENKKF